MKNEFADKLSELEKKIFELISFFEEENKVKVANVHVLRDLERGFFTGKVKDIKLHISV